MIKDVHGNDNYQNLESKWLIIVRAVLKLLTPWTVYVKAATHTPFFRMIYMHRLKSEAKTEHWEGPHIIQSFWLFSTQSSSVVENILDDMLYVILPSFARKRSEDSWLGQSG
jgi:hypothetical protein